MSKRNTGQTVDEMSTDMIESRDRQLAPQRRGQSIYKEKSAEYSAGRLQELIHCSMEELSQMIEKAPVSLENVVDVQTRTFAYLRCCETNAVFPSNSGLSRALGYTNRALNMWRQKKADTPTGKFLQSFSETCAEIISSAALQNNANSIISIFILKSMYEFTDNVNINVNANAAYHDPADEVDIEFCPV